jgi:hypothetical protein
MFTCIGILTSDSGNESILKFVLERKGLSGIILFEHEEASSDKKQIIMKVGFQDLNMVSKIPLIANEQKRGRSFLTNQ